MNAYQHVVKYYECDRMGITHHSNYIRFMEEARIDWMDQMGCGFEHMEAAGVVSPVLEIGCTYKQPTTFKDCIAIEVKVEAVSTLKITLSYTMRVGEKIVCTGRSKHCFLENGRPISIEQRFPDLYSAISCYYTTPCKADAAASHRG